MYGLSIGMKIRFQNELYKLGNGINEPLLITGDMNEILNGDDKNGGTGTADTFKQYLKYFIDNDGLD